jgi:hypothetical protein
LIRTIAINTGFALAAYQAPFPVLLGTIMHLDLIAGNSDYLVFSGKPTEAQRS